MPDASVTLDKVTVTYGPNPALRDVSAVFPKGAVGLLGPRDNAVRLVPRGGAIQRLAGNAERMPGPIRFVTFDPAHIGVALGLGFDVVSS